MPVRTDLAPRRYRTNRVNRRRKISALPLSREVFPYTSLVDDFVRSSLGPRWVTPWLAFSSSFSISGNVLVPSGTSSAAGYTSISSSADCEAWVQVTTLPSSGNYCGLTLRDEAITNVSGTSRYDVRITASTNTWQINRVVTGTPTQIGSFTKTLSANDYIGLRTDNNVVTAWWSPDNITWTMVGAVDDSATGIPNSAGYMGIMTNDLNDTVRFDNFGGGPFVLSDNPEFYTIRRQIARRRKVVARV